MNNESHSSRLIIASGEPAGIGPDILIKLAHQSLLENVVVIADPDLVKTRANKLGFDFKIIEYTPGSDISKAKKDQITVLPVFTPSQVEPGKLNPDNAEYVLHLLDTACDLCLDNIFDAMVTAPLNKSVINDAGIDFTGHTEYLAKRCHCITPVMLLACPQLKVALVTTHLPLKEVSRNITAKHLQKTLNVISTELIDRFAIENPAMLVCGLNPHAGEDGHLGEEEITIIEPVIHDLIHNGLDLTGPVPADTAFTEENMKCYDVFVCMYHDQGLPVLKTLGFGDAVNITLGLPIIRTSVDHGTALSIAGTGKANITSLQAAINMAHVIVNNTRTHSNRKIINEC